MEWLLKIAGFIPLVIVFIVIWLIIRMFNVQEGE